MSYELCGLDRLLHRKMWLVTIEAVPAGSAAFGKARSAPFRDVEKDEVILRAIRWKDDGSMEAVLQAVATGNIMARTLGIAGGRWTLLRADVNDLSLIGEESE